MLSLKMSESIVGVITLVVAYFFVVTIAGVFRAWVARLMGDDTPEQLGFLSFNPLHHMDPFGFFFLIFFGFGWGKYIPINPFNIIGRFRVIKLLVAYLSDSFIQVVMATFLLVVLILMFGPNILRFSIPMMLSGASSHRALANAYPHISSFSISVALIMNAMIYLNVILSVLNFIISGFGFVLMVFADKFTVFGRFRDIFIILIPMFLIFFSIYYLHLPYRVICFITRLGTLIAGAIGVA